MLNRPSGCLCPFVADNYLEILDSLGLVIPITSQYTGIYHLFLWLIRTTSSSVVVLVTESCLILSDPTECNPLAPLCMGCSRQEYWNGLHSLPQRIFPTQGLNLGLLYCRQFLFCLSYCAVPVINTQVNNLCKENLWK